MYMHVYARVYGTMVDYVRLTFSLYKIVFYKILIFIKYVPKGQDNTFIFLDLSTGS